jgi:protein involved in polysaccharide export with SLBB domain
MRTEHVGNGSRGRLKIPATIFILISLVATLAIAAQAQEGSLSSVVDPDEYIVGPGDRFRVDFWDGTSPTIEVTVSPEGFLLLTGIGRADVGNLILSEARARLRELISKYYPDVAY